MLPSLRLEISIFLGDTVSSTYLAKIHNAKEYHCKNGIKIKAKHSQQERTDPVLKWLQSHHQLQVTCSHLCFMRRISCIRRIQLPSTLHKIKMFFNVMEDSCTGQLDSNRKVSTTDRTYVMQSLSQTQLCFKQL